MMTPEQLEALSYSQEGHNILLTGQCGTGKTYALKKIIQALKKQKSVAITSTTGVASCELGFGATTLHHWSGIKDGRMTMDELQETFLFDEQFAEARKRIQETQTLFIDEIGMLSKVMFEKVELLCRLVKDKKLYFGGLQVIASGDFKQLPPVPNYRYNDTGEYCFTSDVFLKTFPRHFNFKIVVRQNEKQLVEAVNQLCDGEPSAETEAFLKGLDRPLPAMQDGLENEVPDVKYLFGTNFDAEYMNIEKLDDNIPGEPTYLKSVDSGKTALLRDCAAQKILTLKVSAPVMLIRNLTFGLYNGCIGKIHSISEDKVVVVFDGRLVDIERCIFEVYDPSCKKMLASRLQFPLRLAYAMTVHRAQGQSLQFLEVDCYSFFSPGQMGVAVGRAMTIDGLRIINYNSKAAKLKHRSEVYDFYYHESLRPMQNLECCKSLYEIGINENVVAFEDGMDNEIMNFDNDLDENYFSFDEDWDVDVNQDGALNEQQRHPPADLICPFLIKTFFENYNDSDIEILKPNELKLNTLLNHHYSKVQELLKNHPKSSSDFATVFKNMNVYLISDIYKEIYNNTIGNTGLESNRVSTKLFRWTFQQEIELKANKIVNDKREELCVDNLDDKVSSVAGSSKLRYIAGACIFHSVKQLKSTVLNKLTKKGKNSKLDRQLAFKKQQLLSKLRVSEEEIISTSEEPDSLNEIKMRQGEGKHLFHVSDDVFHFFCTLNKKLQCHLTDTAFHYYGKNVHFKCKLAIKSDEILVREWCDLFNETHGVDESENAIEVFTSVILDLFDMITDYFIKVALSNGLKRFKSTIPKTKKQALRSKIQAVQSTTESKVKKRKYDAACSSDNVNLVFSCPVCQSTILENPKTYKDQSIGCDFCNEWYHYKCVSLKGNENCLTKKNSKWKCPNCKESTKKKTK